MHVFIHKYICFITRPSQQMCNESFKNFIYLKKKKLTKVLRYPKKSTIISHYIFHGNLG